MLYSVDSHIVFASVKYMMPGRKGNVEAAADVRPKRSTRHLDPDFVYDMPSGSSAAISTNANQPKSPKVQLPVSPAANISIPQNESDLVNMISLLVTRISELELEKAQTQKHVQQTSQAQSSVKMQDIKRTTGALASAEISNMGLPLFSADPSHMNRNLDDGKIKSGYEMKTQFKVKKEVKWPHAHLGPVQHLCPAKPESLGIE